MILTKIINWKRATRHFFSHKFYLMKQSVREIRVCVCVCESERERERESERKRESERVRETVRKKFSAE